MPLLIFLYENLQLLALETFEYLKKIVASEGVLSSLQFAFTALLTLLVATGISLYESRKDTEYEIDKTVISKVFNLKWLLFSLVIATILIFLFNNNSGTASPHFNIVIVLTLIIPFCYLIWVNYWVIDCLANIKNQRKNYLLRCKNGEILDFWEEYLKRLENQKSKNKSSLKQREFYKFKEEESEYIKLFFKKIDNLDFKKDAEFAAQMIEVFLQGFDNINFEVFFYESSILDKLLLWHKQAWKNYYTEIIKNDKDDNNWHDNSYLERVLMDLINKILEKSLRENEMVFSNLIKKIDKHLEDFKDLVVLKKDSKYYYIDNQNFDFHNTLLNNLRKSNFLGKIKDGDSDNYFPKHWIITNPRNPINNYWIGILLNHWLFYQMNWKNLTNGFDDETKNQIEAVIQVFFREIKYDWFLKAILYWRMFLPTRMYLPDNLTRKDKIKTLLDVKLEYPDFSVWMGKTRDYSFGNNNINGSNYVSLEEDFEKRKDDDFENDIRELKQNTITLILELFPLIKENVFDDLAEIKSLEEDETLDSTQKNKLNTIKQIWEEIQKYIP